MLRLRLGAQRHQAVDQPFVHVLELEVIVDGLELAVLGAEPARAGSICEGDVKPFWGGTTLLLVLN